MRALGISTAFLALFSIACSVPIASGLDEPDANEVIGALNAERIAADKERDTEHEERWLVVVGNDDASNANETLQRLRLPRRHSPGLLEAMGDDALISSPVAEHARWTAGTAAELERSLSGLANVLSARVHLAVPLAEPFMATAAERTEPTASVLLQYTGSAPPLTPVDVQRLVAGAVPGLAARSVEVVMRAESPPRSVRLPALSRLGPLTVPRSEVAPLRVTVAVTASTCLAAIGLALLFWLKLRRLQHERGDASSPTYPPASPDA